MADVTPLVRGACAHKGDTSANAVCAANEACGPTYDEQYGEPEAFQTGTGFYRVDVERASGTLGYLLVMATNYEALWTSGSYAEAGPMEVCVAFPFLPVWRCQRGLMSAAGRLEGVGSNERGYDEPR